MVMKTQNEIIQIIKTALDVSDQEITVNTSASNFAQWDSLGQINIIVALDKALDGKVSELEEMATAGSVGRIVEILTSNGLIDKGC